MPNEEERIEAIRGLISEYTGFDSVKDKLAKEIDTYYSEYYGNKKYPCKREKFKGVPDAQ